MKRTSISGVRVLRKTFGFFMISLSLSPAAFAITPTTYGSVPEIDPGSVLSAMALLSGGFMMITDRRRKAAK